MKTPVYISKPCRAATRHCAGFTLIELLVAVAIATIMLSLAIPGFRDFLLNSRMTTQTNELVLALSSAKSEAIKRGIRVIVCSRATNATCAADGTTNWDNGWLVFVDDDNSGAANGNEQVLQVRAALEGGNTLRYARNRVTFLNSGFSSNAAVADVFNLCDSRGTGSGRSIIVSAQGRITSQTGAALCP